MKNKSHSDVFGQKNTEKKNDLTNFKINTFQLYIENIVFNCHILFFNVFKFKKIYISFFSVYLYRYNVET